MNGMASREQLTVDTAELSLRRARECYERREWADAYQLLSVADRFAHLACEDLERLATAAYLIDRDLEFQQSLERAHHVHVRNGDPPRAARCAFWLGFTRQLRGEPGQASGWFARAQRLIDDLDCVEHGYLLLPSAEQYLEDRQWEPALAAAHGAADIGVRFRDADLTACARHLQGRALIQRGQVPAGLALLDETMIAVIRGELSPIVTGLVYCSVIDVCQQVLALSRAREWTSALTRWCDLQPRMVAFTLACLVNRAEVMQFRGAWTDAMTEASNACRRATEAGAGRPPAAAIYRQGEIHRLRGDLQAAEEAYRDASRFGMEPQPGLALLRLAQGRTDAALAAIQRVLSASTDPLRRVKLLPAYIEIALAAGEIEDARIASAELDDVARRYATEALEAMAAQARGTIELSEGRAPAALVALRRAFELWERGEAPYETARVRQLIALACDKVADVESADLEFDAACALFEQLGAAPDLARLHSLRKHRPRPREGLLTARELQVLERIAAGKTNRAIARELNVSERTIDRHVSNILVRLGVPSRAAATAYAYSHKLL
jgi:DNA-binding CsgD family transcriptional regulator